MFIFILMFIMVLSMTLLSSLMTFLYERYLIGNSDFMVHHALIVATMNYSGVLFIIFGLITMTTLTFASALSTIKSVIDHVTNTLSTVKSGLCTVVSLVNKIPGVGINVGC